MTEEKFATAVVELWTLRRQLKILRRCDFAGCLHDYKYRRDIFRKRIAAVCSRLAKELVGK